MLMSCCINLVDIHLDLTSAYTEYSKLNTDILCEACQVKVKDEYCSYHLTDDRFNERSDGVHAHKIN